MKLPLLGTASRRSFAVCSGYERRICLLNVDEALLGLRVVSSHVRVRPAVAEAQSQLDCCNERRRSLPEDQLAVGTLDLRLV